MVKGEGMAEDIKALKELSEVASLSSM